MSLRPGDGCFIEGKAQGEDLVFALVEFLNSSPYVKSARIDSTGNERAGALLLTRFRIELSVVQVSHPVEEGT